MIIPLFALCESIPSTFLMAGKSQAQHIPRTLMFSPQMVIPLFKASRSSTNGCKTLFISCPAWGSWGPGMIAKIHMIIQFNAKPCYSCKHWTALVERNYLPGCGINWSLSQLCRHAISWDIACLFSCHGQSSILIRVLPGQVYLWRSCVLIQCT